MDNTTIYETPGMRATEDTSTLIAIDNYIYVITTNDTANSTTVEMEII